MAKVMSTKGKANATNKVNGKNNGLSSITPLADGINGKGRLKEKLDFIHNVLDGLNIQELLKNAEKKGVKEKDLIDKLTRIFDDMNALKEFIPTEADEGLLCKMADDIRATLARCTEKGELATTEQETLQETLCLSELKNMLDKSMEFYERHLFFVIGGYGARAYVGPKRYTHDIDIMIKLEDVGRLMRLLEALEFRTSKSVHNALTAVKDFGGVFVLVHVKPTMFDHKTKEKEVMGFYGVNEDVRVLSPIAIPEDILLMKLQINSDNKEKKLIGFRDKDIDDVLDLLSLDLDKRELRKSLEEVRKSSIWKEFVPIARINIKLVKKEISEMAPDAEHRDIVKMRENLAVVENTVGFD
jgi:hypothetical protein